MKIEGEVADLVREVAVLGFVRGVTWGRASAFTPMVEQRANFPRDSAIVREVLKSAHRLPESFPRLAVVELDGLTGQQIWDEDTAAANEVVKQLLSERKIKKEND